MNFPVWELPLGGGVLIASVAILHVFIAHFAVGGGLWLVVTERLARRRDDPALRAAVKQHSRFFLLVTLVLGAVTGVGIWFTIGLVSPAAVSALIHAFLWGWAIEWTFFVVEIAAALVYWYGWERLDRRTHETVGWIYFGAAWASLFVINGIVSFMLTPGRWLETQRFQDGFFNPTFWPSLAVRTALAIGQAGLFTLVTATAAPRSPARARLVRYNAGWVLTAVVAGSLAGLWYRRVFPGWSEAQLGAIPVLPVVTHWLVIGVLAMGLLALWPLLLPSRWHPGGAALLVAAGLLVFGAGEWVREAGRKPFVINGYLYSTGLRVADEPALAAAGELAHTRWISAGARAAGGATLGRALYAQHCQVCHTRDGYNGLRPWLAAWDGATIRDLLPRLQHLRGRMPAWHGDADETEALALYLETLRPGAAAAAARPGRAPRRAFALACGLCHTVDGYQPLQAALQGMTPDDLSGLVDTVNEMTDAMPPYRGDAGQRAQLLAFLGEIAARPAPASVAATGGTAP